jgi:hypothetical protein
VTEADWDTCTSPEAMLAFLQDSGRASERKLWLFACACCRRIWHLLTDERSRCLVEKVEQYADGLASTYDVSNACDIHENAYPAYDFKAPWWAAGYASSHFKRTACEAAQAAGCAAWWDSIPEDDPIIGVVESAGRHAETEAQCQLLRDIFGNPVRPLPPIDPTWLTWNDGSGVKLAQGIYHDRAFDRLPVLADALEEAGCDDADILGHLRGPGPHARGCWPLDLVLGKQ